MQALCGFNFQQKKYGILTSEQKQEIDTGLKLPILNNMSLSFMQQGTQVIEEKPQVALGYFDRSNNLIDQVLKIDEKNVKALIRKCSILVEFGEKIQYQKCLKFLEEIVF